MFILLTSFVLKGCLIFYGLNWHIRKASSGFLVLLLGFFLVGSACTEICYAISLFRKILGVATESHPFTLLCRLNYFIFIARYQAFALLLENLMEKNRKFKPVDLLHIFINIIISMGFLFLAIFKFYVPSYSHETLSFEIKLVQAVYIYLPFLFIPILLKIYRKILSGQIPHILEHQLRLLCWYMVPYLIMETSGNPHSYITYMIPHAWRNVYFYYAVAAVICAHALVSKKIISLRFLNIKKNVESSEEFNFLIRFQAIFDQMSKASSCEDLSSLAQRFFHAAFSIPLQDIKMYSPQLYDENDHAQEKTESLEQVESFTKCYRETYGCSLPNVIIREEIEFTHFYGADKTAGKILNFLDSIDAEIFLPIFDKKLIIAYIVVKRGSRLRNLFTNKERDEMIIFTTYLRNIIYSLKFGRLESMYHELQDLKNELKNKRQEITKYRESISLFMRASKEREIGIVYYANNRFIPANEAARQLIGIDLNSNKDHELIRMFKKLVNGIERFKKSQTEDVNFAGNVFTVSGVLSLYDQMIILHIFCSTISEDIRSEFDKLSRPSQRDYTLYFETSLTGQLINQLIPGFKKEILEYKVILLEALLSEKALLLTNAAEELNHAVQLFHHLSLRSMLHEIKLAELEMNSEIAIMLFGLNKLIQNSGQESILEKLDGKGTLFIENVEYLDIETQNELAKFIMNGFFYKLKSNQKVISDVRIICSTKKDLTRLVNEGHFSQALFKAFKEVNIKRLSSLDGGFGVILESVDVGMTKPSSFIKELQDTACRLRLQNNDVEVREITNFDQSSHFDKSISILIKQGKEVLKDPEALALLLKEFKSQSKIANLLGVNRSSVNRRCQEYGFKY